ncbi:putative ATPase/signal transduction histidine kinase [Rhizobium sp. BK650]|uniref:trifunctional serine/threonine-protein kinase/ATP-binding protein/sensor histidine kinase n=1 Tax=Rhizobium sp. BK650 TaxID=2586990 RepID=UPI00160BF658|nr:AAA family ATPase [Rhizobium sp. BK650]MBB3659455.1 putative ATPase/signal transduction histidine kinase [Rhizobium sp. BK650]
MHSDLTVEADKDFVASIAAEVIGDPDIVAVKLHSDVDRAWYRATSEDQQTVLIVAANVEPSREEEFTQELELLQSIAHSTAILHPTKVVMGQKQVGMTLVDPGGIPLGRVCKAAEWGTASSIGRKLEVACRIAEALRLVHEAGLIHGDMRPENCFLTENGEVAFTGFGRAGRAINSVLRSFGTPAYMSPEETGRTNRRPDQRSDLYSLGVTLFELLTGTLPFSASEPLDWAHRHLTTRPPKPSLRYRGLPEQLDAILLKLLEKDPDLRYQSAKAVESDLRRCVTEWAVGGKIERFPVARGDLFRHSGYDAMLYGRDVARQLLLNSAERVAAGADSEVVIVTGAAGIGKSSLVAGTQQTLVGRGFLFAEGKFDQNRWETPYSTIIQAFRGLVRQLLAKDEAEVQEWRANFVKALGENAGLMVDLVPELSHIVGNQPPIAAAELATAAVRFRYLFKAFLSVFATAAHPLVVFVDDLQWLDPATLDLIQGLATEHQLKHTLLVVAYRDDEVDSTHSLATLLANIRQNSHRVTDIRLDTLSNTDLERLLANVFSCPPERVETLAAIVNEKTDGNPFFTLQFLRQLASDKLVTFQADTSEWEWNDAEVASRSVTRNVAQLLGLQLGRLPSRTKGALGILSLLGSATDLKTAALVLGTKIDELEPTLRPAIEAGMVRMSSNLVTFVHDQIQMAACISLDDTVRAKEHLRIGRLLLATLSEVDDTVYMIAGHFDKALELVSGDERMAVARVFMAAGERARLASAYTSAQSYFDKGLSVLSREEEENHPLSFGLRLGLAECDIVNGNFSSAEERLAELIEGTTAFAERAEVICLTVLLLFTTGRNIEAVETGVEFLGKAGIEWPLQPGYADVVGEFEELHRLLIERPIDDLFFAPTMADPHIKSSMDVMTEVFPAAYAVDRRLMEFLLLRMTVLSLRHGLCDSSSVAFSALNMALGAQFSDYATAYQFGELSRKLVDRGRAGRYKARVYALFAGFAVPWIKPLAHSNLLTEEAFRISTSTGDLAFAAYSARNHITHQLMSGKPLPEVQKVAENALSFARMVELGLPHENFFSQVRFIRKLRGLLTEGHGDVDGWANQYSNPLPRNAMMISYHWVFRLAEYYLTEDFSAAREAALRVEPIKWAMRSSIEEAEFEFYAGLNASALAVRDVMPAGRRKQHLEDLHRHHARLEAWASGCEITFACREALLAAEIAQLEGKSADAQSLYEKAIRGARANGFLQVEAIASELAGRFYVTRGLDIAAEAYLRRAREAFARWGAVAKVRLLDFRFIDLTSRGSLSQTQASLALPVASLDIDAVGKASRVLSSEVILASLIEKLMKLVVQNSGAERGVLMLLSGDELYIEATAVTAEGDIEVQQNRRRHAGSELPSSVLHYVTRTKSAVALHDTAVAMFDPGDEYFQVNQPRSILCVPVFNATTLIGLLYVENNVVSDVFSENRTSVLDFLASQAGIWLGNARLYSELQRSEAWLREAQRLSRTGSFYWSDELDRLECSEEIYRICHLPHHSPLTIRHIGDLIHPADQPEFQQLVESARQDGTDIDRQFKLQLHDGSIRDVRLVTRTAYDAKGGRLRLGSLQDVSEMQRTQDVLARISAELAHVSRTATLGVLAASIAHEVSQPLLGVVANAEACQMMLASEPPNLDGARRTAARSLRDGNRAADTIRRLRGLFGSTTPIVEAFDLNDVVREVLTLAGNELQANEVILRSSFAEWLPSASGDRAQVQQVVLNILLNAVDAVRFLPGGQRSVGISTRSYGRDHVRIDISDNGCGIDDEDSERLFEAFYTTKPNGMGVGLSVSKAIIESVGGQIWAAANSEGGATFSFTLKRASNLDGMRPSGEAKGSLPVRSS